MGRRDNDVLLFKVTSYYVVGDIMDNVKGETEAFLNDEILKKLDQQAWRERLSSGQSGFEFDITTYLIEKGFDIVKADLPGNLTGILLTDETDKDNITRIIAIKDGFAKPKGRFIAAHEYAHFVLHKKDNLQFAFRDYDGLKYSKEEQEAEAYARCLLMPYQLLFPLCKAYKTVRDDQKIETTMKDIVEVVKNTFCVSESKATTRIKETGLCKQIGLTCYES